MSRRSFWEFYNEISPDSNVKKTFIHNHDDPAIIKADKTYTEAISGLKKVKDTISVIKKVPGIGNELEFVSELPFDFAIGGFSFLKDISSTGIKIGDSVSSESYDEYRKRINAIERKPVFSQPHPAVPKSGTSSHIPTYQVIPIKPSLPVPTIEKM